MENSVGTFRTDRLMQGDRPSQVTVNTGSTVLHLEMDLVDTDYMYINEQGSDHT